jgi:hypothetical protein
LPRITGRAFLRGGLQLCHGLAIMDKIFKLSADQLKPLAPAMGCCLATDRITVDGAPIGYMYREPPDASRDSGWRFFSGDESEDYANDPGNLALYDVNTIANYDPRIVPFLGAQAPVAYAWDAKTQIFKAVMFDPEDG